MVYLVSEMALIPLTRFAAATLPSPEMWNAISTFLKVPIAMTAK